MIKNKFDNPVVSLITIYSTPPATSACSQMLHRVHSSQLGRLKLAALTTDILMISRPLLMRDQIPEHQPAPQNQQHHRRRNDEIPLQRRTPLERVDIHAEEASEEGQREENEGDPTQPP
jgi:hypothetical protein